MILYHQQSHYQSTRRYTKKVQPRTLRHAYSVWLKDEAIVNLEAGSVDKINSFNVNCIYLSKSLVVLVQNLLYLLRQKYIFARAAVDSHKK